MAAKSARYENNHADGHSQNQYGDRYENNTFHTYHTGAGPSGAPAASSRCVSVPFATVPTYTERPDLSEEISEHLKNTQGVAGLAHALAVVGLGGTGKSQLALHYIAQHGKEYDTILWIDVRSQDTARSSYDRCCQALGLGDSSASDKPLRDCPSVQKVLHRLQNGPEGQRWLAVVDNADDLSWDVNSVIPKGTEGTVMMTSQDARSTRLLGGVIKKVDVDAMELTEAVDLMTHFFGESMNSDESTRKLMEEIVEILDRIALAVDLASARIRNDVDDGDDLDIALRRYLADYRNRQEELLRDDDYAKAVPYKKTIWTVWDTSFLSLQKAEINKPAICATQLLAFLTLFDRANIQDELFRLATMELGSLWSNRDIGGPSWFRDLLKKSEDGSWDEYTFRSSMKMLFRYGLVRPVKGDWKGVTMHGLVQWRAGIGIDQDQHWRLYLVFLTAICDTMVDFSANTRFRRHFVTHLPPIGKLLDFNFGPGMERVSSSMWRIVGVVVRDEGRVEEARQLQIKAVETLTQTLGEEDRQTLFAMDDLVRTLMEQGSWEQANELASRAVESRKKALGEEHRDTLNSMRRLAATWRRQGRLIDAENLYQRILRLRRNENGDSDSESLDVKHNLALVYLDQGRLEEAEKLQMEMLKATRSALGDEHEATMRSMSNLARTYHATGKLNEAEKLQVKVLERRRVMLGENHPETIGSMANLAETYRQQGRLEEAEGLAVKAMGVSVKVLSQDHPARVYCMSVLGRTLSRQGRGKEAEELMVKVLELKSRVQGEDHSDTLWAMADLAIVKRERGQNADALELMRRSAAASVRVLGKDHYDTLNRHKWVAAWLKEDGVDVDEELVLEGLSMGGDQIDFDGNASSPPCHYYDFGR
ncbi:hypothetical protein Q7P37_011629 [Cladosporium fusiforme]